MTSNKILREPTKREQARTGLVALMVVALLGGLLALKVSGTFDGPQQVEAQLADAGGSLGDRADVKINGVIVGSVVQVTKGPQGGVRARLDIPQERMDEIPGNVVARILPATVFGTSYLDLTTHGDQAAESLRPGAVIPADATQETLELQQALDDIDALTNALGPAELASALGATAQMLDGRGEQLGDTVDRLDGYLGNLNPSMPLVREDARQLAASLVVAQDIAPDLLAATNDALVTAWTVVEQRAQIARLIGGGTSLARLSGRFLSANEADVIRFLDNAVSLLDVVYDNRHVAVTEALATNRRVAAKLRSAHVDPDGDGRNGFLPLLIHLDLDPPPAYSSADCPSYQDGAAPGSNCGAAGRASAAWMFGGSR